LQLHFNFANAKAHFILTILIEIIRIDKQTIYQQGENMWGGHWMFGGFMWIFWIAVLVGLIFLIKWLIQQKTSRTFFSRKQLRNSQKEICARGNRQRRIRVEKERFIVLNNKDE